LRALPSGLVAISRWAPGPVLATEGDLSGDCLDIFANMSVVWWCSGEEVGKLEDRQKIIVACAEPAQSLTAVVSHGEVKVRRFGGDK